MRWPAAGRRIEQVSRAAVIGSIGAVAKALTSFLNRTTVHNGDALLRLVSNRPRGIPLVTVSNHMSTLDDPLMWGFKTFPITDAKLARWVLAAEDICFKNPLYSYIFRLGKCMPITRGGGIYQDHMNKALQVLARGEWLHTFPEGKVSQERGPISRLKWGTASLIVRSPITPIVLPIIHTGFDQVMPEKPFLCFKRPLLPSINKDIKIIVGEPLDLDLDVLKLTAVSITANGNAVSEKCDKWPVLKPDGLDEPAQKWLYSTISDRIRSALERLRRVI